MSENSSQLPRDLPLAVMRFARHLRGHAARTNVTLSQLSALRALAECGPLTPGQLAVKERVRPPTVTRLVASLMDLDLVQRHTHPTDGRQVVIDLSEQGRYVLEGAAAEREAWLRERLHDLTESERAALAQASSLLIALIDDEGTQPRHLRSSPH